MVAVELLRRGVADRLRSLAFWCAGVVGYIVLVSAIFPSLQGSADLDQLLKDYPDALKQLLGISGSGSLSSGAGFLDAELFGLMLPILVLVMAVAGGAALFAGEEDAGRLELVLSYPVTRSAAVLAKGGAVALEVAALAVTAAVAIAVVDPIFGLGLSFRHLAAAIVELALIGLFYGWIALAAGAATGNRALAIGAAAGFAAAGYLVSVSTPSPRGSIRSASCRRSGGSAPHRSKTASTAGARWSSPPPRPPPSPPVPSS